MALFRSTSRLPFELRALAAKRSDVLAAMERIFAEEIARVTTRLASIAGARTGSVGFPQRFGSSLNVHVHFHSLAIDGVFEKTAMGVRFHDAPPPSKDDVSEVANGVHGPARGFDSSAEDPACEIPWRVRASARRARARIARARVAVRSAGALSEVARACRAHGAS
ncbi:transposase [Sorangium sp. So ce204]